MGKIIGLTFQETPSTSAEKCPHCGKAYKSREALEKHIQDKHPETAEHPETVEPPQE